MSSENQLNYIEVPYSFVTIDVEDWFHILNADIPSYEQWDRLPSIVEEGTYKILDLLDEAEVKTTFFVLGWIAKKHSLLVKEIDKRGHEIACHGYYHIELNKSDESKVKSDIVQGKYILEQTIGKEVIGYRAPGFSTSKYLDLINMLSELGFRYDASVFPAKRETGGNVSFEPKPFYVNIRGKRFYEFPISAYKNNFFRFPLGGGFSRITPAWLLLKLIDKAKEQSGGYFMFYFHPREVLKNQPKLNGLNLRKYFTTYIGIRGFSQKVARLMKENNSQRIQDIVQIHEGRAMQGDD